MLLAYVPLGLWAAAVLALGTVQLTTPSIPVGWDKGAHFLIYGVGGGIAAWTGYQLGPRRGIAALMVVLLTGAVDEVLQSRLPARNADILDWFADAAGAALLYVVALRLLPDKETDVP